MGIALGFSDITWKRQGGTGVRLSSKNEFQESLIIDPSVDAMVAVCVRVGDAWV